MDKRKTIMASGLFPSPPPTNPTSPNNPTRIIKRRQNLFQWAGVELHHSVLRSPRYSSVSTVGDEVQLTGWLTLNTFPTLSASLLSISSSSPGSALTRICSPCWENFLIWGRPSLQFRWFDGGRQLENKLFFWINFSRSDISQIWSWCRQLQFVWFLRWPWSWAW